MKLINIGSLNIDRVYQVDHFMAPGETVPSQSYQENVGGKGLNQSVAAAYAGLTVAHAGQIGPEGGMLTAFLRQAGVNTEKILTDPQAATGHAVIPVDKQGQNCILLHGGANQTITPRQVDRFLSDAQPGDILLLQNETSSLGYAMELGRKTGMRVVLNPSPISPALLAMDLGLADLMLLNEVEGQALTGAAQPEAILSALTARYPHMEIVLTLGDEGSRYGQGSQRQSCPACPAREVVDTTAAGDTYTGYFVAGWATGLPIGTCMRRASAAAAIAVSRPGAAPSIPRAAELEDE